MTRGEAFSVVRYIFFMRLGFALSDWLFARMLNGDGWGQGERDKER